MRKSMKKVWAVATAAAMTLSALSMAACGAKFKAPSGGPDASAAVDSNGGFVVSVGDYYYFINGVETYTSNNTYGKPVKGALMRVKKSDVEDGDGETDAETVVPSLMVAGDFTAGIFVYAGRVYYATPTDVKDTSGTVMNTYLDFKSAKLDGTDVKSICRLASNSTVYRYVEGEEGVYLFYVEGSSTFTLHSINTATKEDTVLAKNATSYVVDSTDKTNPWIYYTMNVTDKADSDNSLQRNYNQVYRVRADWTECYYGEDYYKWDMDYVNKELGGEIPYLNLGQLVLDGIDNESSETQFNHNTNHVTSSTPIGFSYSLRSYKTADGSSERGVYFVRSNALVSDGSLFYLAESAIDAEAWDPIAANNEGGAFETVANSVFASSKATSSAYFYYDTKPGGGREHHYLYVANNNIYRVDPDATGAIGEGEEVNVAYDIGSATLISIDRTSDPEFDYVYFTRSSGSGLSVERAVFNGEEENYRNLTYGDENNEAYRAVKLLDVQHASGWYNYEILDGRVFFADAQSFGGNTYSYISTVDLCGTDGKLLGNVALKELGERYDAIVNTSDDKTGLFAKVDTEFGNSDLSDALKYYFYTGETKLLYENIDEAAEKDEKVTLYTEEELKAFKAYVDGTEYANEDGEVIFTAENKEDRLYSAFVTKLGRMNENDQTSYHDYWKNSVLEHYIDSAPEAEGGLAWWAWLLIAIAIVVFLSGAAVVVLHFVFGKKKDTKEKQPRLRVDTTDDKDIDVYAYDEQEETDGTDEAEPEEETEEQAEEEPEDGENEPQEEAPADGDPYEE